MSFLQPNFKHTTYKVLSGIFLLIGLTLLVLRIIEIDIPRWVSSVTRLCTSIIGVYLFVKLSKFLPASSLLDYWYKNVQAIYYLDKKITSCNISLSQTAIDSISAYREIIDKIDEIIQKNGEIGKIKKVKRKIYYAEPYDIFEALSECNRFSHELHRVIKKKKYAPLHLNACQEELRQLNYNLKQIYKSAALSTQKKLPKWVRE